VLAGIGGAIDGVVQTVRDLRGGSGPRLAPTDPTSSDAEQQPTRSVIGAWANWLRDKFVGLRGDHAHQRDRLDDPNLAVVVSSVVGLVAP
jgi:hypothetical protein